jgi:hypothetical protein
VARPIGVAVAAQQQQQVVAAQTAYLLELYALQSGAPATPEVQSAIARRATEYFTNGAQATAVPTAGPAAAYFSNGAAVTTIPTSVIPDFTFAPPSISSPAISGWLADAGLASGQTTSPPPPGPPASDAGAAPVAEEAGPASAVAPPPPPAQQEEDASATPATPGGDNAPAPQAPSPPAPSTHEASPPPPSPRIHLAAPPPTTRTGSVLWAMVGGLGVGAMLVLLGARIGRSGGRRRRST